MFLHSGASLHGHEYSDRQSAASPQPAAQNLRYPILWSPFSPAKTRASTTTVDGPSPPAPVLRQRPASEYIPRTPEAVVRFRVPAEEEDARSVMTEDVPSESEFSESTLSMDGISALTRPRRRRRKVQHKHTTYFLGYPTPKLLARKKVVQKVLPRLLLQLQKVSTDGRSRPILEIFPSSRIAGPVIAPRLAKRFPGIFGVKRHLGYDDLVLVRRDDDDSTSDSTESDEEGLDKRKLVAVYSPIKHSDSAEIVLEDGAVWVAKPLPNGSYDFLHEDIEGNVTTVRWVRRSAPKAPSRVQTSPETMNSASDVPQSRYTFSIINPLSRRHPVLASLTQSSLDVQDTYTTVSSFSGRYPRVRPAGRTMSMNSASQYTPTGTLSPATPATPATESTPNWPTDGDSENEAISPLMEPESRQTVNTVEDSTKNLIAVTALWVALRAGWSPNYRPSHSENNGATAANGRGRRNTWSRATVSETCGRVTPQLSESEASQPGACTSKRNSMPAQLPPGMDGPSPPSRSPTPVSSSRILPRRATSTGACFMQHRNNQHSSEATEQTATTAKKHPNLLPPPASHNNTHILSPIPATPSAGYDTETISQDELCNGYPTPIPRSASVMVRGRPAEACCNGPKKEKGGFRSRLARWVHKIGAR